MWKKRIIYGTALGRSSKSLLLLLTRQEGERNSFAQALLHSTGSCGLSQPSGLLVTKNTLQKLATVSGGPEYAIFGNRALYTPENLQAWAEARLSSPRRSTSEKTVMPAWSQASRATRLHRMQ